MRSIIALLLALGDTALAAGNFTVNPSDVDLGIRTGWCESQYNTCNTLCSAGGGGTEIDKCEVSTLQYDCKCRNGTAPGLEYYIGSMDFNICQKSFENCIESNVGNAREQEACKTEIFDKCGSLDPADAQAATEPTTTSDSASTTETPDPAGSTQAAGSDSDSNLNSGAAQIHHFANAAAAVAIVLMPYML